MQRYAIIALTLTIIFSWSFTVAQAATILFPSGGGTGWGYPGGIQAHTVVIGNGLGAFATATPSTAGYVLTSNGVNADPTFQPASSGAAFAWTPATNFGINTNSTTTPIWFKAGLFASSTAPDRIWVDQLSIGSTTSGTLATSTDYGNFVIKGNASTTALVVSGLGGTGSNSIAIIRASGVMGTIGLPVAVANGGTGASTFAQGWIYSDGGTNTLAASSSPTVKYIVATSSIASQLPYASTTAISSAILTSGNCVQAGTNGLLTTTGSACSTLTLASLSATFPLAYNSGTGAFTFNGIGTSSPLGTNQVVYSTGVNTLASVATTSVTYSTGLDVTVGSAGYQIGGSALTIKAQLATSSQATANNIPYFTTTAGTPEQLSSAANLNWLNSANWLGVGTTTPQWLLTLATSTRSQLTLSDGTAGNLWSVRGVGGFLYFATSSASTFATSTKAAISITPNGYVGIATTSPGANLGVTGDGLFSGNVIASNFVDTTLAGTTCVGESSGLLGTSNCVSSVASAGGTITVSPSTGNVDVSIALGHANTWTGAQMFLSTTTIGNGTATGGLTVAGTATTTNLTITSITGTQCLHAIGGVVSGTGSDCGAGGGTSAFEIATTSSIGVSQLAYFNVTSGRTTLASVATSTIAFSGPFSGLGFGALVGGSNTTITWTGLATSSAISAQQVLYATGVSGVASVATGTISGTNGVTVTAARYALGGSATIDCTAASISATGCLSAANFLIFNNKVATSAQETANNLPYWTTTLGTPPQLGSAANLNWINGANWLGVGTTTPRWLLTLATSTAPQLDITDNISNGWAFRDTGNYLYISPTNLSTFATSSTVAFTLANNGYLGVGSTTPWAMLSIASSSYNYTSPLLVVATSTDQTGMLLSISATSSSLASKQNPLGAILDSGVRIAIGAMRGAANYFGNLADSLDQLFVNGRINTGTWKSEDCVPSLPGQAATMNLACADFRFTVDGAGTFGNQVVGTGVNGIVYGAVCEGSACSTSSAAAANSGAGLFFPPSTSTGIVAATSTPVLEAMQRINTPANATSTYYYLGFTNTNPTGSTLEAEPTAGCYFVASTTNANWQAQCRTSIANTTTVDTGFASTSNPTANGEFYQFRLEMDNNGASFYMASTSKSFTQVARITTNYPSTVQLVASDYTANLSAGNGKILDIARLKLWYNQPALNYSY